MQLHDYRSEPAVTGRFADAFWSNYSISFTRLVADFRYTACRGDVVRSLLCGL